MAYIAGGNAESQKLESEEARKKLQAGLDILHSAGIFPKGFVPPEMLISEEAKAAVLELFDYCIYRQNGDWLGHSGQVMLERNGVLVPSRDIGFRTLRERLTGYMTRQADPEILRVRIHPENGCLERAVDLTKAEMDRGRVLCTNKDLINYYS